MKYEVGELREKLVSLFKRVSDERRDQVMRTPDLGVMDAKTRADFDLVWDHVVDVVHQTVDSAGVKAVVPGAQFYAPLERVLAYQMFAYYDAWVVREDVSDAEVISHAKEIKDGNLSALAPLHDTEKTGYVRSSSADAQNYMLFLGNLEFLNDVLAHQAKRYNSFAAARAYLKAASSVRQTINMACPYFVEDRRAQLIGNMQTGDNELSIAIDYAGMKDWDAFRREKLEPLSAKLKRDAAAKKDGK